VFAYSRFEARTRRTVIDGYGATMSEPVAIAELAPAQANLPIETGDFHENLFSDEEDGYEGKESFPQCRSLIFGC
jgi:hypothetical protein